MARTPQEIRAVQNARPTSLTRLAHYSQWRVQGQTALHRSTGMAAVTCTATACLWHLFVYPATTPRLYVEGLHHHRRRRRRRRRRRHGPPPRSSARLTRRSAATGGRTRARAAAYCRTRCAASTPRQPCWVSARQPSVVDTSRAARRDQRVRRRAACRRRRIIRAGRSKVKTATKVLFAPLARCRSTRRDCRSFL